MDDAMCWSTARATTRFVPHGDLEGLDDNLNDLILATNVRGSFAVARVRALLERSTQPGLARWLSICRLAAVTAMGVM